MRLIHDPPGSAAHNMAVDESIFMELIRGKTLPTLRFYSWKKPTLSLGYLQKTKEVDFDRLKSCRVDLVRRPTGGRAVLHWNELTFCMVFPGEGKSLWEIFKRVHEAIGEGIKMFGIPAEIKPGKEKIHGKRGLKRNPACFASPTRYELCVNGKKLVGTAQKLSENHVLVHGSIALETTADLLFQVLSFPSKEERRRSYAAASKRMTTIYQETGKKFSPRTISDHIVRAVSKKWNCRIIPGGYTEDEMGLTEKLIREKYENPDWLYRR